MDENFDSREADAVCSVEFQWTADTRMPVRFLRYIPAFSYYAIILRDLDPQRLARMRGAVAAVFYAERLDRDEVFAHLAEEVRQVLSSTVDAYERKLKEAARKEGREEGREQGRHKALLQTTRKMLAHGSTVDYVAEVTELPRDEVGMLAGEIPSGEAGPEGRAG